MELRFRLNYKLTLFRRANLWAAFFPEKVPLRLVYRYKSTILSILTHFLYLHITSLLRTTILFLGLFGLLLALENAFVLFKASVLLRIDKLNRFEWFLRPTLASKIAFIIEILPSSVIGVQNFLILPLFWSAVRGLCLLCSLFTSRSWRILWIFS